MEHLKRVEEAFTRQAETFDAYAPKADGQVEARFAEAVGLGRAAVRDLPEGTDLLVLGEMGIGNTTAAAAVSASLPRIVAALEM